MTDIPQTLKVRRAGVVVALLLSAIVGWRFLNASGSAGRTPALRSIDAKSLAAFKNEFNRAIGSTRVILLLSPT
ncbi:MAG: hypothetical protein M3R62_08660 [Acidobacteriota bacterium]|nr:hypothetical protein [Acidobacteriota bacterium]